MSLTNTSRILIYRVGHLGDTIIALPALAAVRESFPVAHITLLGNAHIGVGRVSAQDVIPNGLIDAWLSYPSNDRPINPGGRLRLLVSLRRRAFDTLIYLAPRIKSPVDIRRDLLFFRLAGIRRVLGDQGFQPLPSRNLNGQLPNVEHEADHLLHRLSLSGISVPSAGSASVALNLSEEEKRLGTLWWRKSVPAGISYAVGFGPGSKWPSKVWPEERFLEVGFQLIKDRNIFPVIFGGPEDRELGERLLSAWGRGANAAGELSVRHAAAALSRCVMYVGNDTGTMHLAAAAGVPCVAIMSALDWPGHWNPYGTAHTVLRRSVPCEGCLLMVCEREAMRCLKEIAVEGVVDACIEKLALSHAENGNLSIPGPEYPIEGTTIGAESL